MLTTYAKIKVFPDGEINLTVKQNVKQTPKVVEHAKETRFYNRLEKAENRRIIINELNGLSFLEEDRRKRERLIRELETKTTIQNAKRSARRARQTLYDICKCNEFLFFVTFTYSPEEVDRLNDEITRRTFSVWANKIRKYYPNMYYIAVPEYHKKGGLHYHLLIGGIKWEDLKPKFYKLDKNGAPIYSVTAWKWGWSTVSRIKNTEATKHYICKYITKQHYDDRFYQKRRFHTSHNIIRPNLYHAESEEGGIWKTLNLDVWKVQYLHERNRYGVFTFDGTGEYIPEYNDNGTRETMKRIARACAEDKANAARAARGYLTIGTLNRKAFDIEKEKRLFQQSFEDTQKWWHSQFLDF